jgi:hypothetical protein
MSVLRECVFLESTPGEWFYILERTSAPKDAYDWRDYADAYGPFRTKTAARHHLHSHHSNPGGATNVPYTAGGRFHNDPVVLELLKRATLSKRF